MRSFLIQIAVLLVTNAVTLSTSFANDLTCESVHQSGPEFTTFNYSQAEIKEVLAKYPQIATKIETDEKALRASGFSAFAIPLEARLSPRLTERLKTQDPRLKKTLEAIWKKLNDSDRFADYIQSLSEDTAVEMSKRSSAKDLSLLEKGELSRSALLKVLVRRFKQEKNSNFSVIRDRREAQVELQFLQHTTSRKYDNNGGFREAVGQGPFWDVKFAGSEHGMDHHFLQINYVADVIWKETEGDPRLFWDFLGSRAGINYWTEVFDNQAENLSSPEFIGGILSHRLPLQ